MRPATRFKRSLRFGGVVIALGIMAASASAQSVPATNYTVHAAAEVMNVGGDGGDGAVLSKVETGDGVDDIHYVPATHLLYVGAVDAQLSTS